MARAAAVLGLTLFGFAMGLDPGRADGRSARPDPPPPSTPDDGAPPPPHPQAEGPRLIIKAAGSPRWSTKCDPQAVRRLRRGDLRLVLSLHAYDPPKSGNSTFVVTLVSADGKVRRVVDRFAPFPNQPFRATPRQEPHRFQFDLSKDLDLLDDGRLTVEVGFDPARGSAEGGLAEFTARLAAVD